MSMPTGEINRMSERVEQLEEDLRRWRRGTAMALVGITVVVAGIAAATLGRPATIGTAATIEAERFVLVDSTRQRRGELLMEQNGSPSLGLYDAAGRRRVRIALDVDGHPRLTLADTSKARIWMAVGAGGVPELLVHDEQGAQRVQIRLDQTGAPAVVMSDAEQTARLVFWVDQDTTPAVLLRGEEDARASLSIMPDGSPLLGLLEKDGSVRFRVPERSLPGDEAPSEP